MLPVQSEVICKKMRLSAWLHQKSCRGIRNYSLKEKCFWIPVGLGVHPLLAKQFASSRNQAHRTLSWSSAKPVTLSSALFANLIGIQVKAVRRTCQSLFFQEKQVPCLKWKKTMLQSSAVQSVKFTLNEMRVVPRWCVRTANMPFAGTVWNLSMMTFSSYIMTKDLVEISWDTPGHLLSGTEHRWLESLQDLVFYFWWPPLSFYLLHHLFCAASANVIKEMTTLYLLRPREDWTHYNMCFDFIIAVDVSLLHLHCCSLTCPVLLFIDSQSWFQELLHRSSDNRQGQ